MLSFLRSNSYLEIHSALPLGECLQRLQKLKGESKAAIVEVNIGDVDADFCKFQMHVQRRGRTPADLTVYGALDRSEQSVTRVQIAQRYTQHLNMTWLITALMAVVGAVIVSVTQNIFMFALPIGVSVVLYLYERESYKQVVTMIQNTLEAYPADEKSKRKLHD